MTKIKLLLSKIPRKLMICGGILILLLCSYIFHKKVYYIYNQIVWSMVLKKTVPQDTVWKTKIIGNYIAILLKGKNLTDLSFCKHFIGVNQYVLYDTNVTSIDNICNDNLRELTIVNSPVQSLVALRKCISLNKLTLANTFVREISPLKNLSLKAIGLYNCPLDDLNALENMSLKSIVIGNCPVKDLSPLKTCYSLVFFQIKKAPVSDISPLKDLSYLNVINIEDCPVFDVNCLYRNDYAQVTFRGTNIPNEAQEARRLSINGKHKIIELW